MERPFYEEIEEGAAVFVPDGARLQEDAPIFREKPQYVDENVPPFYDAMAEEFAARQAEEESEQSAGMNFLDEFVK